MIWTGDSARHDNDEKHPRTVKQILNLNKFVVDKFKEVFGKTDDIDDPDPTQRFVIPIVPTYGNNDILPHNILTPGPNQWTQMYQDIWRQFIPEAQRHSFARGGWFFVEVIPNKLAVFSLNTLYFFDSNSAVDGCDAKSEPGYEHMEWLRVQLQLLRERGMKAILIGHVPPARTDSKQSWDESCWQKYTLWLRQYRDVVVGNMFGHMNLDHFTFQDVKHLKYDFKIDGIDIDDEEEGNEEKDAPKSGLGESDITIMAKSTYLNELRDTWSSLPTPPDGSKYDLVDEGGQDLGVLRTSNLESDKTDKKKQKKFLEAIGGQWAERYSISMISPSVVPNFYPTLRVIEYNMTGLEKDRPAKGPTGTPRENEKAEAEEPEMTQDEETEKKKKKKKGKKKKPKKPSFKVPSPPAKSSPPGPAYSPQTFTFLGFKQYYANLTAINAEYERLQQNGIKDEHAQQEFQETKKGKKVKFKFELEYDTRNDSVYDLEDLTMRNWLGFAKRMEKGRKNHDLWSVDGEDIDGKQSPRGALKNSESTKPEPKGPENEKKKKKLKNRVWKTFVKRAFVLTKPDEKLDDKFGEDDEEE